MAISKYPNVGCYVTEDMHKKFRFLAWKKGTSVAKLMYGMIQLAVKDIKLEDIDKAKGVVDESKTSTGV
jgi:hypothetical protein